MIAVSVSLSVCLSCRRDVQMVEWIDVLFAVETPGNQRNIVLDEDLRGEGEGASMRPLPDYFGHLFSFCC